MGLAAHSGASDPIGQRKTRLLSATPAFTRGPHAELAALGGVDAEQANALPADLDGVAVDDGCDPGNAILRDRTDRHEKNEHKTKGEAK